MSNKVREMRLHYDLTQEEVALNVGISRSALSEIERGRTPHGNVMLALSKFFGREPEYLFGVVHVQSTAQELIQKGKRRRDSYATGRGP